MIDDPAALPAPPTTADLSGFPLLRLDQLPCVDTDTLVQSVALLRKQLGGDGEEEASKGEESLLDALFCRVYARRQLKAMARELQRRGVQTYQPMVEDKSPSSPPEAVPFSVKDAARPHVKITETAYPPLVPLVRSYAKAEILPMPPTLPPGPFFVIRSSRPKLSIRGGRSSRAIARARMQQYKAWRLKEEEQSDVQETDCADKPPSLPPAPSLPPMASPPLLSPSPTSPPAEPAPPPPPSPSPPPLPAPAPFTPSLHPPPLSSPPSPPVSPLPEQLPSIDVNGLDREPEIEEPTQGTSTMPNRTQFYFRLGTSSSRPEVQSIVTDVFADTFPDWRRWPGETEGDDDDDRSTDAPSPSTLQDETWHLLWTWSKPRVECASLLGHQRVNHIPRSRELTRKDLLVRHLTRHLALSSSSSSTGGMTRLTASARARVTHQQPSSSTKTPARSFFHIMPQTFSLPQVYTSFVAAFRDDNPSSSSSSSGNVWILKPVESSRGRGIKLVDDLLDVMYSEPAVIQRYITNPLLLNGYKFDLRLYVLVTSFQPTLEAFLYTEGFARFCTAPFQLQDLGNALAHVSNSSIQTRHATRGHGPPLPNHHPLRTAPSADVGGSKLRLSYLWQHLREDQGIDTAVVWNEIVAVVLKSLVCVEDVIPSQPGAFELFGFDVLLDSELRPWLLEVNASPSLAREHALDREVKEALMVDTIRVIMGQQQQQQQQGWGGEEEVGGYQRLCPGTEAYRKVQAYKRRYVRTTNKTNSFR